MNGIFDDPRIFTEAGRVAIRDELMKLLAVVTADAEKHWAEDSNCGAAPLCIGSRAFATLGMVERERPGVRDALLLVCIREIFDGRKREAVLRSDWRSSGESRKPWSPRRTG